MLLNLDEVFSIQDVMYMQETNENMSSGELSEK